MLNIRQLLQNFDRDVIARGKEYYLLGQVTDLNELSADTYEAIVEGSYDYTVSISSGPRGETLFDCDCPYHKAPYCKHVVATLFAIEEHQLDQARAKALQRKKALTYETLNALPKKELVRLILAAAQSFPSTASWFLAQLGSQEDMLSHYRGLIRATAAAHFRHGYIDEEDVFKALTGVDEARKQFEQLMDCGEISAAVDFCLMIIEETVAILDSCDDSYGAVDDTVCNCIDDLESLLAERVLPADEAVREAYFRKIMEAIRSDLFGDWPDWQKRLYDQCEGIAEDLPALREPLLQLLAAQAEIATPDTVNGRQAQETLFHLLLRWKTEEEAFEYAASASENNDLRLCLFERLLTDENYPQALQLCLRAEQECASSPGSLAEWQKRRYTLCGALNDIDAQKELGETLLLAGNKDHYARLQALYSPDEWPAVRGRILDQLKLQPRCSDLYLNIITAESDQRRMMEFLRVHPDHVLALYRYLSPEYAEEIQKLFYKQLHVQAAAASDRGSYQIVCGNIRSYKEACGRDSARQIAEELYRLYKRRPAFQDELKRLLSRL